MLTRMRSDIHELNREVEQLTAQLAMLKPKLEPPKPMPQLRLLPSQQRAVEAVVHVVQGQRRRPVVLQADRGRGELVGRDLADREPVHPAVGRVDPDAARARLQALPAGYLPGWCLPGNTR